MHHINLYDCAVSVSAFIKQLVGASHQLEYDCAFSSASVHLCSLLLVHCAVIKGVALCSVLQQTWTGVSAELYCAELLYTAVKFCPQSTLRLKGEATTSIVLFNPEVKNAQ